MADLKEYTRSSTYNSYLFSVVTENSIYIVSILETLKENAKPHKKVEFSYSKTVFSN